MTLYSLTFLTAFLPFSAFAYRISPRALKPILLSAVSIAFYMLSAGEYFYLLPLISLAVYALSFVGTGGAYLCIVLLVLLRFAGVEALGLSFFMLRAAAYIREGHRERNFAKVLSFLMLFPTVAAGPITRYSDVRTAFDKKADYSLISRGILCLLRGAVKKLFFADTLFGAFELFLGGSTFLTAVFALVSFTLYIYFDFSGYSDAAIGVCNMFGIRLPKNFDFPYLSRSVGEFFRRWHISLGRWLFDFVYLPLGGSRHGRLRTVLSLFAVWLFSALWHGSGATYLIWGAWFFFFSVLEKFGIRLGRVPTLIAVILGWVPFFSKTPKEMTAFTVRLFSLGDTLLFTKADIYNCLRFTPFLLICVLLATPLLHRILCHIYQKARAVVYLLAALGALLLLSCIAVGGHRPFLYASF